MNIRKTRKLQKEQGYQYLCEDSKSRVYLALVPSRKARMQRMQDISRAVCRSIRFMLGTGSAIMLQMLLTMGSTLMTYEILSGFLESIRGYKALGSEIFFAASVGIIVFRFLNFFFGRKQ